MLKRQTRARVTMAPSRYDLHIPALRFVKVDDLVLHEQHDPARSTALVERLERERVLRNPPVVAPMGNDDGRYVVLDGANRSSAARALGLPHLVVQVVDYDDPDLHLSTWYHLVTGCLDCDLANRLFSAPGVTIVPLPLVQARAALARREIISYIVWVEGRVDAIRGGQNLAGRVALLNVVVDAYQQRAKIYRVQNDDIDQAQWQYGDVMAVVTFPHYEPAEIIELARSGIRLPAGITRHIIPCRALRINIPLTKLREDAPLEDKNAWLATHVRQKLASKQARYYQESTWLFDE
jgi:hypothetical protein